MKKESDKTKGIDTTQAGKIVYVADDIPLQTVIYAVEDVLGNNVYFIEEAEELKNTCYIIYRRSQQF